MKNLKCTYLYADGHAVQIYSKRDPDAGEIEFAEITEKFTTAKIRFSGRLVFHWGHDALADLCRKADRIDASEASIENGSEASRRIGQPVGYLTIYPSKDREIGLHFYDLPGLLSGAYSYQPDTEEKFNPNLTVYGAYRVSKVHLEKRAPAAQVATIAA